MRAAVAVLGLLLASCSRSLREAAKVMPSFATTKVVTGLRWEPDADVWLESSPSGFELLIKLDSAWTPSNEKPEWKRTASGPRVKHSMHRGMGSARMRFDGWSPSDEAAIATLFESAAKDCLLVP